LAEKLWYLVTYDVREPKRLRDVAKHLEGYGERLQFSVFRCRLTERELERLRWELTQKMSTEDNLLIVGLCARCGAKVSERQGDDKWTEPASGFEIV
jgi:CRISPR-associated protein Cas2